MSRRVQPTWACLLFMLDMGPYQLRVEMVPKKRLGRKNENSEADYNAGWLRLADHLSGKALVEAFLFRLIGVIHYTHGLDDESTEEHFTHSFASGVLEFATRNPEAWHWLNDQFSALAKQAPFGAYARGKRRWRDTAPQSINIGPHSVELGSMDGPLAERVWGYYMYRRREVLLHAVLEGRHLAVIVLHELTHAFHYAAKLRTRESRRRFTRIQAQAWLTFVRADPNVWCWFVHLLRSSNSKSQALWPLKPVM